MKISVYAVPGIERDSRYCFPFDEALVVIDFICSLYHLKYEDIIKKSKGTGRSSGYKGDIIMTRNICVYVCSRLFKKRSESRELIAKWFGVDRCTTIYSLNKLEKKMDCNEEFRQMIHEVHEKSYLLLLKHHQPKKYGKELSAPGASNNTGVKGKVRSG